jgi:HAMP domain-containing protein
MAETLDRRKRQAGENEAHTSLRVQTLLVITLLLTGTVLLLSSVLTWNARQAMLAQQKVDGLILARLLARTATIVDTFPQEMENVIGEQMIIDATITAHMVAIGEQGGMTPAEIDEHLRQIVDTTALSEFWITDETGHAYLRNMEEIDFTFSPDPQVQPQASAFWPLITGQATSVVQEAQKREVDNKIFKYVGVGGVDKPRIVQVGYEAGVLEQLRERVGLRRLVEQLVAGGDVSAIRVVDQDVQTLVFSAVPGLGADQPSPVDVEAIQGVIESGEDAAYLDGGMLKAVVPIYDKPGGTVVTGAVIVYMPTDQLNAAVGGQIVRAGLLAVFVLAMGLLISLVFARRVTAPVERITRAAREVESGEYHPASLADLTDRSDELGRLARVFDSMARGVSARDRQLRMLRVVIPVGVSLSAEKNFNHLLETLVVEAQNLTNAEGGTLYLQTEDSRLRFVIMRNSALNVAMGGTTGVVIPFEPIRMYTEDGHPNHENIATYAALEHQRVNIADAYDAEGFDFTGTRVFDAKTGYRSKSFLTIPLEDNNRRVIGILQLINSRDPATGEIVKFEEDGALEALVLLATAALDGYVREEHLRREIAKLRIQIDESRRTSQVAEITETEYFRLLQSKARQLRRRKKKG